MIICICNNISDTDIKKSIQAGNNTIKSLNVGTSCGKCIKCTKQILNEEISKIMLDTAPDYATMKT